MPRRDTLREVSVPFHDKGWVTGGTERRILERSAQRYVAVSPVVLLHLHFSLSLGFASVPKQQSGKVAEGCEGLRNPREENVLPWQTGARPHVFGHEERNKSCRSISAISKNTSPQNVSNKTPLKERTP